MPSNLRNNRVGGIPILPGLPPWLAFTQGTIYHVKPYSGSDNNDGLTEDAPLKTLDRAQTLATADQNDIVLLYAESNTSTYTTDYLTTTLLWAKDGVHLIGVNSGCGFGHRSRVAWASTASSGSNIPLVTVSGDNCYIAHVSFVVGSSDANLAFGVNVTGDHELFEDVCFNWPVHATSDAAGGYALKIDGCDESKFKDCSFGSFTIDIGTAANSHLLIDGGCSFVTFENCTFVARVEHASNGVMVRTADANALGFGNVRFKNCGFEYNSVSGGYTLAAPMTITASQVDGRIYVDANCYTRCAKWDNSDANMIEYVGSVKPADDTSNTTLAT